MAHILCIETATTNCSVALSVHGSVAALKEDNSKSYSHGERLHVYISEILATHQISEAQIDAIAVSKGPGSYTGLRIGVSAAKGLCYAWDKPLIAIPTLQTLAHKNSKACNYVIPMIDARRMEVYAAVFSSEMEQVRETRAEILDASSFNTYLDQGPTVFIGNGVSKFAEICKHEHAVFITEQLPSAQEMAKLAQKKFEKEQFEDVAYFEPYYLKDFISG